MRSTTATSTSPPTPRTSTVQFCMIEVVATMNVQRSTPSWRGRNCQGMGNDRACCHCCANPIAVASSRLRWSLATCRALGSTPPSRRGPPRLRPNTPAPAFCSTGVGEGRSVRWSVPKGSRVLRALACLLRLGRSIRADRRERCRSWEKVLSDGLPRLDQPVFGQGQAGDSLFRM